MDKENVKYMCGHLPVCVCVMDYHSAIRKKEILSFMTTWMYLEGFILNEMSGKYYITSVWNLKKLNS